MVTQCPYNDSRGFCAKKVVNINEMGSCKVLWRKGQLKGPNLCQQVYPRKTIEIIEEEYREEDAAAADQKIAETATPQ